MRRLLPLLLVCPLTACLIVVPGGGPDGGFEEPGTDGGGDGGLQNTGRIEGTLNVFQGVPTGRMILPDPMGNDGRGTPAPRLGGRTPDLSSVLEKVAPAVNRWPKTTSVLPGEVIVRFEAELLAPEEAVARARVEGWSARHGGYASPHLHLLRFSAPDGSLPGEPETGRLAARIAALPGVAYAEPNRRMYPAAIPGDRFYPVQWHYPAMNLPAAWDLSQGSSSVVVAVVDTGGVPHPDLDPRTVAGIDLISDPAMAQDGDGRDEDPTDLGGDLPNGRSSWHGTHVAGTVGAATHNEIGVAGVDWNARLQHVRVLGKGGGTTFDIAAGMNWAVGGSVPGVRVNATPASVVNLSLGGTGPKSQAYQEMIDLGVGRGAVFVVAAGNNNEDTANTTPCNQDRVICVGATRVSGKRSSFSNFGAEVDVMAPGGELAEDLNGDGLPDGILSTFRSADGQPSFDFQQGTSMAAPHVSGLVALMRALNEGLQHAHVESLLKSTAHPNSKCDEGCGAGGVNAYAAVAAAMGRNHAGPPKLAVTTSELFLSSTAPAVIGISNTGGEALTVVATAEGAQGHRLSFPSGSSLSVQPGRTAALQVAGNLVGLAPGIHAASIKLASNGGVVTVNVRLSAAAPARSRPAVVALVYEDAQGEWQVAGGGPVSAADGYRYRFDVAPGRYYVLAGIDDDEDGEFFEPGEPVGLYRSFADPVAVTVTRGQTLGGVDFALVPHVELGGEPPALVIGGACEGDAGCPDGGVCDTDLPGGYCTRSCSTLACPAGSRCYAWDSGEAWCLATCAGPGEGRSGCRADYVCYDDHAGQGLCWPGCSDDEECLEGETCDAGSGYCVRAHPAVLVIGGSCQDDDDCPGGVCDTSTPGGYCTAPCDVEECPTGGECFDLGDGVGEWCLATCLYPGGGRSTCRTGYVCEDFGIGICLPACTRDEDCEPGTCDEYSGYCK